MKKFLLSLCVLAVASVCVFMTSCKDEESMEQITRVNVSLSKVFAAEDPAYTYTYTLNGVSYTTPEAVQAAVNALPAGSEAVLEITATNNADPTQVKKTSNTIKIPAAGSSVQSTPSNIVVPGTVDKTIEVSAVTTTENMHSGGQAN